MSRRVFFVAAGMVLTVTIPLYAGGEFLGIAGIDLTLQDLFVEIYALDQEVAHGIVLDSLDKRVFAHVLLPEPSTVNNARSYMYIFLPNIYRMIV